MDTTAREEALEEALAAYGRDREQLVQILLRLQERLCYLPPEVLDRVAVSLGARPEEIRRVVRFYPVFRTAPAGKHRVSVCIGTACHVKGAPRLIESFKEVLGITGEDDTDADRLFTVSGVACLGCCQLAPAVRIDDVIYGHVRSEQTGALLRDFLADQAAPRVSLQPVSDHVVSLTASLCDCSSCTAGGAREVRGALEQEAARLRGRLAVESTSCSGAAYLTPLLYLHRQDGQTFRYASVTPTQVPAIIRRHLDGGIPQRLRRGVTRLIDRLADDDQTAPPRYLGEEDTRAPAVADPVSQVRIVTEGAGETAPLDLAGYERRGGWDGLKRAAGLGPDGVLAELERSGLRGRGGAGYPAHLKWRHTREAPSGDRVRYLVVNADEGDPGAFMDRMLLESFPFRVIEGISIGAMTLGAAAAYVYIRAEYPLAVDRFREAVNQVEQSGLFRRYGINLHIEVKRGAGRFVCGEETALIEALAGNPGIPRDRPPYPSVSGFRGRPTLISNVETFANVPWIMRQGGEAFARYGGEGGRGTKAFALAGKVRHGGLVEIELGTPIRRIVEEIGGGVEEERVFKAVQIGGPSGGCIPAELADTPVDYEALPAVGAMMGSGGLVVLDDRDCLVDMARYFMEFCARESCGRCRACKRGTAECEQLLALFCRGAATGEDMDRLERLCEEIPAGSLCGLGRAAVNPVKTTLRYFRHEYEAHLRGRCPALVCRPLIRYTINDSCIGCGRCARHCPVDAIPFAPYARHEIAADRCIKCGTCRLVCPVDAVDVSTPGVD